VDDTYNANTLSIRRSIESTRLMAGEGRLVLVLGDMKELGQGAAQSHRELGALVAGVKPAAVYFQGEFAAEVAAGAQGVPLAAVTEPAQVLAALAQLNAGGTILVKGSRSCRMEAYAKALLEHLATTGGRP